MHLLSPGLVLAILVALIGAQVARLADPEHGSYWWRLLLAAGGVVAGEVAAVSLHVPGPALGAVHLLPDAVAIALLEWLGGVLVNPTRRRLPLWRR